MNYDQNIQTNKSNTKSPRSFPRTLVGVHTGRVAFILENDMKLYSIRAERSPNNCLYLCNTWNGHLSWTYTASKRAITLPMAAASATVVAIREIVPKSWKLEIVEEVGLAYQQDDIYYIENLPNV